MRYIILVQVYCNWINKNYGSKFPTHDKIIGYYSYLVGISYMWYLVYLLCVVFVMHLFYKKISIHILR